MKIYSIFFKDKRINDIIRVNQMESFINLKIRVVKG
jgi:hypothetical protein